MRDTARHVVVAAPTASPTNVALLVLPWRARALRSHTALLANQAQADAKQADFEAQMLKVLANHEAKQMALEASLLKLNDDVRSSTTSTATSTTTTVTTYVTVALAFVTGDVALP